VHQFLVSQSVPSVIETPDMVIALRGVTALVHRTAKAVFYAPGDPSGVGGMKRETIYAVPTYRKTGKHRHDTVFLRSNTLLPGMRGLRIARVYNFLQVRVYGNKYSCALVHHFNIVGDTFDEDTRLWIVEPAFLEDGSRHMEVVPINKVIRGSHLLPVFSADEDQWVPVTHSHMDSLDAFSSFYVNRFIDLHAFRLAF
jgi:hypothetical protein